jgi:hypothetical protein
LSIIAIRASDDRNTSTGDIMVDDELPPQAAGEAIAKIALDLQRRQKIGEAEDKQDWLAEGLSAHLPPGSANLERAKVDAAAIAGAITQFRDQQQSARDFRSRGGSNRAWLESALSRAAEKHGTDRTGDYVGGIDQELARATQNARSCVTRVDGNVNQNQNLHGFIAEEHHTSTYNIDSATRDLSARAEQLNSTELNSPDIVIKDNGATVGEAQAKWGKTSDHTSNALEKGDYAGQERLVPTEQQNDIAGSTDRLEHGGASSKPLSHEEAKQRQEDAQERGQSKDYDWDDVSLGEVSKQLGKQVLLAAALAIVIQGARIGGRRCWNKLNDRENPSIEDDWKEFVDSAIKGGAQAAGTVALSGALVVAARKGLMGEAMMDADAGLIALAVCVAIENAKVLYELSEDNVTLAEASGRILTTNFVVIATIAGTYGGKALGTAIGVFFGPIGAEVGAFVGGMIGSTLSSMAANKIVEVAPALAESLARQASDIASAAAQTTSELMAIFDNVRNSTEASIPA